MPKELQELLVDNVKAWSSWLDVNATSSEGVWLVLAKKNLQEPTSLTVDEAVQEALCYGWINGQARRRDESTTTQRFVPRTKTSVWAKRNVDFAEKLIQEGRMKEAGLKAIEAAKADGRWERAYAGGYPGDEGMLPDFVAALDENKAAKETWNACNKSSKYTVYFQLSNLKTQAGREKRIKHYIDMLAVGEHPKSLTATTKAKEGSSGEIASRKKRAHAKPEPSSDEEVVPKKTGKRVKKGIA